MVPHLPSPTAPQAHRWAGKQARRAHEPALRSRAHAREALQLCGLPGGPASKATVCQPGGMTRCKVTPTAR